MYQVHAVHIADGRRHLYVVGRYQSLEKARRIANSYTCAERDYAYITNPDSAGIVHLQKPMKYDLDPNRFKTPPDNLRRLRG